MTDYDSALNMPYNAWVRRQAAIKRIPSNELERILEITQLRVEGNGWTLSRLRAIEKFNKLASGYDAITDLQEKPTDFLRFLGFSIVTSYIISGTAIREK